MSSRAPREGSLFGFVQCWYVFAQLNFGHKKKEARKSRLPGWMGCCRSALRRQKHSLPCQAGSLPHSLCDSRCSKGLTTKGHVCGFLAPRPARVNANLIHHRAPRLWPTLVGGATLRQERLCLRHWPVAVVVGAQHAARPKSATSPASWRRSDVSSVFNR